MQDLNGLIAFKALFNEDLSKVVVKKDYIGIVQIVAENYLGDIGAVTKDARADVDCIYDEYMEMIEDGKELERLFL